MSKQSSVYEEMPNLKVKELSSAAMEWLDSSYFGWESLTPRETDYPGDLWWHRRIYVPVYGDDDSGEPISAVTRHYDGRKGPPKYLSGPLGGNDGLLLPLGSTYRTVVLTEGVFDAAAVANTSPGMTSICVFGVELRPAQIAALLERRTQRAVVLFDPDRASKAVAAQWELESWGIRAVVASHLLKDAPVLKKREGEVNPKPDPANISPEYLKAVLHKAGGKL